MYISPSSVAIGFGKGVYLSLDSFKSVGLSCPLWSPHLFVLRVFSQMMCLDEGSFIAPGRSKKMTGLSPSGSVVATLSFFFCRDKPVE